MNVYLKEVYEQPTAIQITLEANKDQCIIHVDRNKPFLFTGMGSSLAAGQLVSLYLNSHGTVAASVDNSELLHYQTDILDQYNVVVISQSGESIEAIKLIERYPYVIGVTNTPGSSLALRAKEVFYTCAGKEEAITATKTFTTTAALLLQLASKTVQKNMEPSIFQVTKIMEKVLQERSSIGSKTAKFLNVQRPLMFLGRGPSVTTADLSSLLFKEGARVFTESLSLAQFRHGPFELLADEGFQCFFFNPFGKTFEINHKFAEEIADHGGKVVYISDQELIHPNVLSIQLESINEFVSPVVYAIVPQLAIAEISRQKGLVIGQAELLSKVTVKE